jgi:S1-C subfamily serine protease
VAGADAECLNGVQVAELAPMLAQAMRLPRDVQGVVVQRIEAGSAAAQKLQPGDIIERVNQQPVTSVADFGKLIRALPESQPVMLSIVRERTRTVVVLPV